MAAIFHAAAIKASGGFTRSARLGDEDRLKPAATLVRRATSLAWVRRPALCAGLGLLAGALRLCGRFQVAGIERVHARSRVAALLHAWRNFKGACLAIDLRSVHVALLLRAQALRYLPAPS